MLIRPEAIKLLPSDGEPSCFACGGDLVSAADAKYISVFCSNSECPNSVTPVISKASSYLAIVQELLALNNTI